MSLEQLNQEYGIDGQLRFIEGKGGLTMIEIDNGQAAALISVHAGQALSFKPHDAKDDLLFVGATAYFDTGKAIKGGIPICWPWFGPDPEDKGRPAHGFVRSAPWSVIATEAVADGSTVVKLGIADNANTRAIWPHAFNLIQVITVGPTLQLELVTKNPGDLPFSITQGFHTYFKVGDVTQAQVLGLEDKRFIDKVADDAIETQDGHVAIHGEVNRIYQGIDRDLLIDDASLDRRIRIRGTNSSTCVVWNPWIETARAMGDLADDDYLTMLCVETLNADSEIIEVPPRGEVMIGVELGEDL